MFDNRRPIDISGLERPLLLVVIDTEEDFDWDAEPRRDATRVDSMTFIHRVQEIFDEYGIRPCYVADYPIADHWSSASVLKEIHDTGQCEIGAHLHPWVCPPYSEPLTRANMYPGNLEAALELEKLARLARLASRIEEVFGQRPTSYKAGRYGFGPATASALERLGFDVDLSICPAYNHGSDGGPDYGEAELVAALGEAGLEYSRPAQMAPEVARLINEGAVVARFDGRMEYGPRALGNRSVLYHAKEPQVNQWLNRRLGRTEFMPFAPVTLFEARHRFYHNVDGAEDAAQFMTITFDCTDEMKTRCPAAVHVDGTVRPQLIKRETNPGYYDIVDEYGKLTGVPCLINTSFNMHEEPIVNSPRDAIRAFTDGRLDYLILGPFLARGSGPKTPG